MILHCSPYRTDKNLGKNYNEIMRLLGPDDSACFTDGDSCHLTPDYGTIIEQYHETYPNAVLTCKTNRIHHLSKQLDEAMDEKCDIRELIKKAEKRCDLVKGRNFPVVTEIKPGEGCSGVMLLVPKKIWEKVPFWETGKALGVDTQFRIACHAEGIKILIMEAILLFHVYRLGTNFTDKSHLL